MGFLLYAAAWCIAGPGRPIMPPLNIVYNIAGPRQPISCSVTNRRRQLSSGGKSTRILPPGETRATHHRVHEEPVLHRSSRRRSLFMMFRCLDAYLTSNNVMD